MLVKSHKTHGFKKEHNLFEIHIHKGVKFKWLKAFMVDTKCLQNLLRRV